MSIPQDRKYSESHEWFQIEGDLVTVGISQFAADELTDITYVDLPEVGSAVSIDKPCAEIESVKATAELISAINGTISAVNESLVDKPELVNDDPFGAGWMIKVKCDDLSPLDKLMSAEAYEKHAG